MLSTASRILIAYYSRRGANYLDGRIVDLPVGNTEVVAKAIQGLTGGDLFHIETVKPYPADYHQTTEVSRKELSRNARPELARLVDAMDACDVVFLGNPNWWSTMPMAVWTFLEAHDFTGKTILPFCTHEGSGLGQSESDIRKLCPGAEVLRGLALRGGTVAKADKALAAWLKEAHVPA